MKYTETQLRVIYKALKGANLLGMVQSDTGYNRQSVWNTFNTPHQHYVPLIVVTGIKLLKDHNILQDAQLLTELLND
jgi:hypothetical protein